MTTRKPQFVYVTYIQTTPEKVWAALQDPEMTKQYWGMHKNVSDWKVGSSWTHQDYETGEVHLEGKVLEAEPPKKLVVSWGNPGSGTPSKVTFLIEPFMNAVRLTVMHDELAEDGKMLESISQGWPAILSSLKSLMETGQPLAMTTRRWAGQRQ
ncbi:polyketide cyclase [Archangium minus]|uniref:Polyketide cyclase n=1 Tax=Archangium minus TaxID=83450 RepID=A0ABY9WNF4_9BACT|nr:polyketide cyclase [Archangium minus]